MAEVFHVFEDPLVVNAVPYDIQVCGRPNGHVWEGWIEFIARDGSDLRRTPRETTQPDRGALAYWATGLSQTYFEGAFARTLEKLKVVQPAPSAPYFDAPAPSPELEVERRVEPDRAILDPFSVGAKGEVLLRRELGALRGWHLRNIIRAYDLADPSLDLERLGEPELVELIVAKVVAV